MNHCCSKVEMFGDYLFLQAFKRMVSGGTSCQLFSLGKGKYYQEDGELTLDVGPFTAGKL